LEQSYRADPVSQQLLLSQNEGKVIEFEVKEGREGETKKIVKGKIIRSGYVPHYSALSQYGNQYYQRQMAMANVQETGSPIVEVDGRLYFSLPGTPIFPTLGEDTVLKPELDWQIRSDRPGAFDAELSYITGGMRWEADYNLVAPEKGDGLEMIGWVTFDNQSGRSFRNASVKLMAGEVNKIQPEPVVYARLSAVGAGVGGGVGGPSVTEKAFDEYHLYSLQNPVTLRDRETKQVEFLRAQIAKSQRIYVYDGLKIDPNQYQGWTEETIRQNADFGTNVNPKVWVMQEFKNSQANGLGMPLPKGRVRFYRRDADGRMEFTGENTISHTPKDETVRVYSGSAFDLVGERTRTDYYVDHARRTLDESFEIKVRNHKEEAAEVRVVEHLYRGHNWTIAQSSFPFDKKDSRTAEFRINVPANSEQTLKYSVHYTW
jgi:hypothetical protein